MIGVFDSGLGGLTVVRELFRQLPGHDITYFGDTARLPYGTKGPDVIRRFAVQDTDFLLGQGAKAIIVACNTVSSLAIDVVRERARGVPVFEVITPAVIAAAAVTKGRVGVIGTSGTIASGIHAKEMALAAPDVKVFARACPLFVPLVEEGWMRRPETASIANEYLRPLRLRRIDTLILGCTHYPFLKPVIAKSVPGARLIDPARETVAAFARHLGGHPELRKQLRKRRRQQFFVSDRTTHFVRIASRWLGREIDLENAVIE
ncbi:MAG: Glutamate racemase [Candidatus Parcubacteria bacterium]|jgi:glutamate racemase